MQILRMTRAAGKTLVELECSDREALDIIKDVYAVKGDGAAVAIERELERQPSMLDTWNQSVEPRLQVSKDVPSAYNAMPKVPHAKPKKARWNPNMSDAEKEEMRQTARERIASDNAQMDKWKAPGKPMTVAEEDEIHEQEEYPGFSKLDNREPREKDE